MSGKMTNIRTSTRIATVSTLAVGLGTLAIGAGVLTSGTAAAAPGSPAPNKDGATSINTIDLASTTEAAAAKKLVKSNVHQLREIGVTIGDSVLIDVADDGLNRYLAVGRKGRVNFTGTKRGENTQMSLKAAWVTKKAKPAKNRVVIKPDWYNEDLGPGQCVTDVRKGVLKLKNCTKGKINQAFKLTPAGDSGQFEMKGAHTQIRVNKGKITTKSNGYTGLQTINFAQ